jgi:hypothetical protein
MFDISPSVSSTSSAASFSTACTSLPPTEIKQAHYDETEEKSQHQQKKLQRHYSRQRREITNQTLLLSSPLATLIYTASTTAAAVPLTSTTGSYIPPRDLPAMNEKGKVLRKKRASGGRPERLVRMGGPETKIVITNAGRDAKPWSL